jgi:hypothetical protein
LSFALSSLNNTFSLCRLPASCNEPWVEPSSEAPGHLRIFVSFLLSLSKIIIDPDLLIDLLEKLLQGLGGLSGEILCCWSWAKSIDHGFDDNLIWHH